MLFERPSRRLDKGVPNDQPSQRYWDQGVVVIDLLLFLGAATAAAAPGPAAPPMVLPPSVEKDVQCFLLYAAAVSHADQAKEENTKIAASIGLSYFFGKLKVEAPGTNLAEAIQSESTKLDSEAKVKEIGTACDTEFRKSGAELIDLGRKLEQPGAKPPAS